ncbi:PIR protein CIR protein, fragment [Plasmodium vinckei petteri]|uniref:PIR protein CIR protein n=1 Tax=Plasmodium vinckei petteri TaxID=138298 RepID=A0A6V7SB82_PLAVN|nr:PIR protein CIR protein, fragment [Plasmodium vinckei petteri]
MTKVCKLIKAIDKLLGLKRDDSTLYIEDNLALNNYCPLMSNRNQQKCNNYEETLNGNSNNTDGSSYRQILSTLSTDYDNLKKKCNDVNCKNITALPTIKTQQISEV